MPNAASTPITAITPKLMKVCSGNMVSTGRALEMAGLLRRWIHPAARTLASLERRPVGPIETADSDR